MSIDKEHATDPGLLIVILTTPKSDANFLLEADQYDTPHLKMGIITQATPQALPPYNTEEACEPRWPTNVQSF